MIIFSGSVESKKKLKTPTFRHNYVCLRDKSNKLIIIIIHNKPYSTTHKHVKLIKIMFELHHLLVLKKKTKKKKKNHRTTFHGTQKEFGGMTALVTIH